MSDNFEIAQTFTDVGNQLGLLVDAIGYIAGRVTSKAPIQSPEMTGIPTAPTAAIGTNSTQIATTACVQSYMSVTPVKPVLKASWTSPDWIQLGLDINGEATDDNSGYSVSLSDDGLTVAIGAPYNNGNGDDSGQCRVYTYNSGTSRWTQLGLDIDGEASYDFSGISVSLSSDGRTVAIGAYENDTIGYSSGGFSAGQCRVYTYNSSASRWEKLGLDIDGEAIDDKSGNSVSLSADGRTVAIGAPYNNGNGGDSGQCRVYTYNSVTSLWTKLGQYIDGEAANDISGFSVSMSADGRTVAIGAMYNSGKGQCRIYTYNSNTSRWEKLGLDIDGEASSDASGYSVSLSSDGRTVAIGATGNDGAVSYSDVGQCRVYTYNSVTSLWTKLGQDIDGEAADDRSGISVSISSDGRTVAIGAYKNSGNGSNSGHCRVYTYNSGTSRWTQFGKDIDGEAVRDQSGLSVSLSSDGRTVAIGAPYNDGNGSNSGQCRIYKLPYVVVDSPLPISLTSVTTAGTTALWIYISGIWRQIKLV